MERAITIARQIVQDTLRTLQSTPPQYILLALALLSLFFFVTLYLVLYFIAPIPRPALPSEKNYQTILPSGETSEPREQPCWYDRWAAEKQSAPSSSPKVQDAEIFMSVVVPAYNEEERLGGMLEEAVDFLQKKYGDAYGSDVEKRPPSVSSEERGAVVGRAANGNANGASTGTTGAIRGWEILVVSDGSTDKTVETALKFARDHQLNQYPVPQPGPWTSQNKQATQQHHGQQIPHGSIRVIILAANRGKGGAVTHGLRHARGQYTVFADADGASKFEDLEKLVEAADKAQDSKGRAVAIGSRAHLVGSEAVVKRSALRNLLMRGFHLFIRILTPPATSRIRDTQCGFKLFTRATLPDIIPYMHMEGWIFDVEMLMLSESAGVPMVEVPVGWKEVLGSKLNVVWDSIGMAVGLATLRGAWGMGVYRRW